MGMIDPAKLHAETVRRSTRLPEGEGKPKKTQTPRRRPTEKKKEA
jgi:hypothetical protein